MPKRSAMTRSVGGTAFVRGCHCVHEARRLVRQPLYGDVLRKLMRRDLPADVGVQSV